MSDTSGLGSPTPFAYYDRDGSCWRTSQGTFPWGSESSSVTWPPSGMTAGGFAFELPTSEHRISANDCSSSPTPNASLQNYDEDPQQFLARAQRMKERHGNGNGVGMPLGIAVRLLPTPRAQNGEPRNSKAWERPLDQPQNLENALARLPKP